MFKARIMFAFFMAFFAKELLLAEKAAAQAVTVTISKPTAGAIIPGASTTPVKFTYSSQSNPGNYWVQITIRNTTTGGLVRTTQQPITVGATPQRDTINALTPVGLAGQGATVTVDITTATLGGTATVNCKF